MPFPRYPFVLFIISLFVPNACAVAGDWIIPEREQSPYYLEKIVVSAGRAQTPAARVAQSVEIIDAGDIAGIPARNAAELVDYVAGVDLQRRGGFGRASTVSIRGSDSRQVRVMIDGIPFNTQSSGQVNLSQFPVENIERVEIVRGALSSAWGTGLGGVINIITKQTGRSDRPAARVSNSFAEFRTRSSSAQIAGRAAGNGYYLLASQAESGGRGWHDDTLQKNAFGKVARDFGGQGELEMAFGYNGGDVNSGLFPDGSWQSQPYRTRFGKALWRLSSDDAELTLEAKHSRQEIITRSYLAPEDSAHAFEVQTKDSLYQASVTGVVHPGEHSRLVLGSDADYDVVKSNLYLAKAKTVQVQAPYASYLYSFPVVDLHAGLRYDRNSEFGSQVSPSAGLVYHIPGMRKTRLRLSASRAFTSPPLLWKFNEDPLLLVAPNPDIKPERAWVFETGIESGSARRLDWSLSLYRADVKDALAMAENEDGFFFMKNFQKFTRQGADARIDWHPFDSLDLGGSAAFNDIKDVSTGDTVQGGGTARQSFGADLTYRTLTGFTLSVRGYYNYWNEPASSEPNDRKMLVDLKISQTLEPVTVFLNVYNLGNSAYWADIYFPEPLRYFEGGCALSW